MAVQQVAAYYDRIAALIESDFDDVVYGHGRRVPQSVLRVALGGEYR
jgi:hypothetical protein